MSFTHSIKQIPTASVKLCLIYVSVVSPQMVEHGSLKPRNYLIIAILMLIMSSSGTKYPTILLGA